MTSMSEDLAFCSSVYRWQKTRKRYDLVPSQTSFRLTSQPCSLGVPRKSLTPESLGRSANCSCKNRGDDFRHDEPDRCGLGEDQIGDQLRIQDPEEVLEAGWRNLIRGTIGFCLDEEGQGCPEELRVVSLQTSPDADLAMEVLGELDQDRRHASRNGLSSPSVAWDKPFCAWASALTIAFRTSGRYCSTEPS